MWSKFVWWLKRKLGYDVPEKRSWEYPYRLYEPPCAHSWQVFINPAELIVRCVKCPEVATTLKVMAWAEARRLGSLELWSRTFQSPEDVPRAQRIPGAFCLPLIAGTEKEFGGAYKGYSALDVESMKGSRQDLYLDKLNIKATDETQKRQNEELEETKRRHDKILASGTLVDSKRKAELDRALLEANEKDED